MSPSFVLSTFAQWDISALLALKHNELIVFYFPDLTKLVVENALLNLLFFISCGWILLLLKKIYGLGGDLQYLISELYMIELCLHYICFRVFTILFCYCILYSLSSFNRLSIYANFNIKSSLSSLMMFDFLSWF